MDREELREALGELAERLDRQHVSARIYIIGGAAMALAYDAERATRDIDAVILDHHTAVTNAVREIGKEHGWPTSWLNEQASSYVPQVADAHQRVVFEHPALRVIAASPTRLLAMKARAARSADQADITKLAAITGLATVDAIAAVVDDLFPGEPLSVRSRKVLEDLLTG
jgi:predicted nucleotidyltransferase